MKPTIFNMIAERIYRGGHVLVVGEDLGSVTNVRQIIADDLAKEGPDPKGKLSVSSIEHVRGASADVLVGVNLTPEDITECVPVIIPTGGDLIQVTTTKSRHRETKHFPTLEGLAKYLTPEAATG